MINCFESKKRKKKKKKRKKATFVTAPITGR